jgi:hypothetical protein
MTQSAISYVIMAVLLVLIGWLHLATLVLTVLFGYFALRMFSFGRSKTRVDHLRHRCGGGWFRAVLFLSQVYKHTPCRTSWKTIPAVVTGRRSTVSNCRSPITRTQDLTVAP